VLARGLLHDPTHAVLVGRRDMPGTRRRLETFADLMERPAETGATSNPVRSLPKSTRRLYRPDHDPRTTPFVEKLEDVRRIFLDLDEPVNVACAIGAFAGLRTGEVLALAWDHVDLTRRTIHVRESIRGPLKDKDSRIVPVLDPLLPILTTWKLRRAEPAASFRRCGPTVPAWTSTRSSARRRRSCTCRGSWYQATRHTFASHWVSRGGTIEDLREIMGPTAPCS
jgi:integrase